MAVIWAMSSSSSNPICALKNASWTGSREGVAFSTTEIFSGESLTDMVVRMHQVGHERSQPSHSVPRRHDTSAAGCNNADLLKYVDWRFGFSAHLKSYLRRFWLSGIRLSPSSTEWLQPFRGIG